MKTVAAANIATQTARHGAVSNFRLTIGTIEKREGREVFVKVVAFDPSSCRVEQKMGVHAVMVGPFDDRTPLDYFTDAAKAKKLCPRKNRSAKE